MCGEVRSRASTRYARGSLKARACNRSAASTDSGVRCSRRYRSESTRRVGVLACQPCELTIDIIKDHQSTGNPKGPTPKTKEPETVTANSGP